MELGRLCQERPLLAIAALGLALRLGGSWLQSGRPPEGDAAEYAAIAQNLVRTGEFATEPGKPTARRAPLYPSFLALWAMLFPDLWEPARLAQGLLDATTPLLLYAVGTLTFRRKREALIGPALYAIHPVFIAYAGRLLTEVLFFWIWALALWLVLKSLGPEERGPLGEAGSCALAGIACGAAILCRPTAIAFPLFAVSFLALVHRRIPRLLWRLSLVAAFSYLTLLPWAMRNRRAVGHWTPVATGGGVSLWVGTQAGAYPNWQEKTRELLATRTDAEADAEFYRLARKEYLRNWPRILLDLPRRAARFWLTSHSSLFGIDRPASEYRRQGRWGLLATRVILWALHLLTLAAGAWGLWLMRSEWTPGCTLALAAFLYYSGHVLIDYGPNRYHLPALMLWLLFAGRCLLAVADSRRAAP